MLATGAAGSLREVRAIIDRSFPTEIYEPADSEAWQRQVERFEHYCEFTYARDDGNFTLKGFMG
jgi:hypothetical protein